MDLKINLDVTEIGNRIEAHRMIIQMAWNLAKGLNSESANLIKSICLEAAKKTEDTNPGNLFSAEMQLIFADIENLEKRSFTLIEGGKKE